jgi:hypothetical protein
MGRPKYLRWIYVIFTVHENCDSKRTGRKIQLKHGSKNQGPSEHKTYKAAPLLTIGTNKWLSYVDVKQKLLQEWYFSLLSQQYHPYIQGSLHYSAIIHYMRISLATSK